MYPVYYSTGFLNTVLFALGLSIGSFLNVVAMRYRPEKFLFGGTHLGGRSHCPYCSRNISWYELVPFFSFLFLKGKCRKCKNKLSWQYPIGEIVCGFIFLIVPAWIGWDSVTHILLSFVWIFIFLDLWVLSLVDLKWRIIPDESLILLVILGLAAIYLNSFPVINVAPVFRWLAQPWWNALASAGLGLVIFGGIVLATRGQGMGLGDVKMAMALGWIFGWPAIAVITFFAFVTGGFFGLGLITLKRASLKSAVPFGPFLSFASLITFLFGQKILDYYLSFMS